MIKQKKIIALIAAAATVSLSVLPAYAEPGKVMPDAADTAQFESGQPVPAVPAEDAAPEAMIEPAADSAPTAAVYSSYTFGDGLDNDTSAGGVKFYGELAIKPVEPSEETSNLAWVTYDGTSDIGTYRTEIGGSPCVFSTTYSRPKRTDNPVTSGFICFDASPNITTSDRDLTFEIEYFDQGTNPFSFTYVNGPNNGNFKIVSIPRTGTDTWKTFQTTVTDAYLNRETSTQLVDGKCDYRIDCKTDTYIRRVAVYNCPAGDFEALNTAAQALSFPFDPAEEIDESFALPQSSAAGIDITWESNSPATSISGSSAVVTRAAAPVPVTLTATVLLHHRYVKRSFDLTVAAEPFKAHALTIGPESWSVSGGKQVISVPVSDADLSSGSCVLLLLATDKNSGMLTDIVTASHALGAEASFTLTAQMDWAAHLNYSFYIMTPDGFSLKNSPPASVKPAINTQNRKLILSWDKVPDDFQAVSEYAVIMDGEELGRVSERSAETGVPNSYTVSGISTGEQHEFSVIAYDHEGLASLPYTFPAGLERMAEIDLADCTDSSGGISFVLNDTITGGDSYTEETERGGIVCRKNVYRKPITGGSLSFLYFAVDRNIISSNEKNVTLEITYFDEGTGSVILQYNAVGGVIAKQLAIASLENTNTWKTAVVQLTDAAFTAPVALTNSDFRITASGSANGEICIAKVAAIPTSKY